MDPTGPFRSKNMGFLGSGSNSSLSSASVMPSSNTQSQLGFIGPSTQSPVPAQVTPSPPSAFSHAGNPNTTGNTPGGVDARPNNQRIEAIKQYYNQLCTNLRHISNQLNAPDLTPQRKITLLQQQEQVQKSLQEFTEKVLRPLASAAAGSGPQGATGLGAHAPIPAPHGPVVHMNRGNLLQVSQNASPAPSQPGNGFLGEPAKPIPSSASFAQPSPAPPSVPPLPVGTAVGAAPPVLFPYSSPAFRQTIAVFQKQQQQVQQQQALFQHKIISKHFDTIFGNTTKQLALTLPSVDVSNFKLIAPPIAHVKELEGSKLRIDTSSHQSQPDTIKGLIDKINPAISISDDVEQALLRMTDEFIDNIGILATKLAVHRKDLKVMKKDIELALQRSTSIVLPGSYRNSTLAGSVKKLTKRAPSASNPHQTKLTQLKKFMASQQNL